MIRPYHHCASLLSVLLLCSGGLATTGEEPKRRVGLDYPADICTIGERGPGKALSFCLNNGTCLLKVTAEEEHPGCDCADLFTGRHCEMSVRKDSELPPPSVPPAESQHRRAGATFVIVVGCLAAAIFTALAVWMLRRENQTGEGSTMIKMLSVTDSMDLAPDAMYSPSFRLPRQKKVGVDPTMVNLAPRRDPAEEALEVVDRSSFHYPVVDIGPQRDEDGNDLHEIELL